MLCRDRRERKRLTSLFQQLESGQRVKQQLRRSWFQMERGGHGVGTIAAIAKGIKDAQLYRGLNDSRLDMTTGQAPQFREFHGKLL
jgi:hypothetical protein